MSSTKGTIFDIKKFAIHDGPGIRTTVFFKGCPLRCAWCHNPESWNFEPEPMQRQNQNRVVGRQVTCNEIMDEILKDLIFYDESAGGVTFSGGEPLAQPDFLQALLNRCRKHEIHTAVDTSGYAPTDILSAIIPSTDLFLCDIKIINRHKHKQFTGVENHKILDNIALLASEDVGMVIRVPLIPDFNDNESDMNEIGNFISKLKGVRRVDLLPYNSGGVSKADRLNQNVQILRKHRPNPQIIEHCKGLLESKGIGVTIGG